MSTPTTDQPATTPLPQPPAAEPTPPWVPGVRAIAAGVALVLVVVGTVAVVSSFFLREHTEVKNFTGTVTTVRVTEDVGDIRVTADAAGDTARVTAKIMDSFSDAKWDARLQDTTLVVEGSCEQRGISIFGCDVDLDISLPPGGTLQLTTDTGDLSVSGAFRGVDVSTSTGDVDFDAVAGPVRVRANTGDIRGLALSGRSTDVETETGDVRLEFLARPDTVSARTNTGDVRVEVPDDATVYAVTTDTDTGDVSVDVPNVPTASNKITATTDTGDIEVSYQ